MSGPGRPNNRGIAYSPVGNHTPHDSTEVSVPHNAISIDADGDVAVTNSEDVAVTLLALKAGVIYPVHVTLIKATGTTATNVTLYA